MDNTTKILLGVSILIVIAIAFVMIGKKKGLFGEQENFRFASAADQTDIFNASQRAAGKGEQYRYAVAPNVGNMAEQYRYASETDIFNASQRAAGKGEQYRYAVAPNVGNLAEQYRYEDLPQMQTAPQRPSLIAPVPPRFDAMGLNNNLTGQLSTPMDMLAAPPSASPLDAMTYNGVDFQNLGGSAAPMAGGALTSDQASNMLKERVGGGRPELQNTKDLMPVPDMRYTVGMDPTDPQNFMYDRTIFGRLKRRYGNGVDFIRGDLDVKPEYRGWFDLQPPTENDIVVGYFDKYIDIEQETAIRDATFTRNTPVEDLYQSSVNPGGAQYLTRYNHV